MRTQLNAALLTLLGCSVVSSVAGAEVPPAVPQTEAPRASAVASPLPFIDVVAASSAWAGRPSSTLNLGGQVGLFVARRLRLSARLLVPTATNEDVYYFSAKVPDPPDGYSGQQSKPFSLLYGASAGVVAVSTPTFALSPGVAFVRSNVSAYGSMLALALPAEWVTRSGVRIGFEVDAGRVLGGSYALTCTPSSALNIACANGPSSQVDRPSGAALWLQLTLGYAFGHS